MEHQNIHKDMIIKRDKVKLLHVDKVIEVIIH